jgi:hypothetical protein
MDASLWIFEYSKRDYEDFLRFVRGFIYFYNLFGKYKTLEEAEKYALGAKLDD